MLLHRELRRLTASYAGLLATAEGVGRRQPDVL